ncbi:WYL domain-containing protein [Micromonospora sp. NPDC093277]|uniref:WYL domain-containing protein n=1 Tax=Micromonospora sp. NPDC093277 TaxID=3364291 RepID=UPI0037F1B347
MVRSFAGRGRSGAAWLGSPGPDGGGGSAGVGNGDVEDPGDAEAVGEHPEARRPLRGAELLDDLLPGGDVAAYVTGVFRGSEDASGNWPCQGTVLLDLPAATVALYTRDGLVEQITPDRCRLTLGSWSWPSLAAAIARYDADIDVVGPDELTEAFAHLARRFTRTSAGHTPTQPPPGDGDAHEASRR